MPDVAPKSGEIGGVKKEYVYAGGGVLVVLIAVVYMRSKQSAAATANTATVTDPAGNVCAALNPSSGYCPGTAQDLAYTGTLEGTDSSSFVGGQIVGYDANGNPVYSSNSNTGSGVPGSFQNNAEWTQYVLTQLQQDDPNIDSGTITAALGVYINGDPATGDQQSIIQQAIAIAEYPPVGGTDGYPPNIKNASPSTATTTTVNIPGGVAGLRVTNTTSNSVGLAWNPATGASAGYSIAYGPNGNTSHTTTAPAGQNGITIGGLTAKTKYTFNVAAKPSVSGHTTVTATTKAK